MAEFFEAYYGNADLGSAYCKMRQRGEFKKLAENFEMISSRLRDVFVPYGSGKEVVDALWERKRLDVDLLRRLQRYTVGLQPWEFGKARNVLLSELTRDSNVWIASEAAYDDIKGLVVSAADAEKFVI
jgi:CRISPR-associated endonuclease/helicase Cas3